MNNGSPHHGSPHRRPACDMTVAEILEAWPQSASVFLHRRMACPGCAMAPFMTLREAAESYGLDPEALLTELAGTLAGAPATGPFQPALPHRTETGMPHRPQ